jgi:hypothetical protein
VCEAFFSGAASQLPGLYQQFCSVHVSHVNFPLLAQLIATNICHAVCSGVPAFCVGKLHAATVGVCAAAGATPWLNTKATVAAVASTTRNLQSDNPKTFFIAAPAG